MIRVRKVPTFGMGPKSGTSLLAIFPYFFTRALHRGKSPSWKSRFWVKLLQEAHVVFPNIARSFCFSTALCVGPFKWACPYAIGIDDVLNAFMQQTEQLSMSARST